MPVSIVASVDPTTYAVRLTITGGTPDYVVDAAPGGDRGSYRVRSTFSPVTGDPDGRIAVDGAAPLNTPVQYVVTDKAGLQASSNVVTVTAAGPVLSDALDPSRHVELSVVSQPPNTYAARSVWWDVLGGSAPFASIAPMRMRSGDLVLYTGTLGKRAELRALLLPGTPLLLRAVCPDAVDDVTMLVAEAVESLALDKAPAGGRLWTLTYQALSPEQLGPYSLDPARAYSQLPAERATYADLRISYTDYRALLSGDPYAGLGPELLVDGGFAGGQGTWSTFFSSGTVLWSFDNIDANVESAAAGGQGVLWQTKNRPIPATGPRALRVTGRVRSTSPATAVQCDLWTNLAPAEAGPFQPGALKVTSPIVAGPTWSTFSLTVGVPDPAHDVATLHFVSVGMPLAAVVEWDDLSMRWLT